MKELNVLGVNISKLTQKETLTLINEAVRDREKKFIATANPEIIVYANKDEQYMDVLQKTDLITPDGIGVVKGVRILGEHIPERVAGFDLFMDILKVANENKYSIYMLGAKDTTLNKAVGVINEKYPNVQLAGSHHGFFDDDDQSIIETIKHEQPDFIFVALGFPRQEKWIAKNIHHFKKGVFMGLGGSFDVLSGEVQRAPKFWRRLNLEWFYRLVSQPARWKRMLSLPKFILKLIKTRF
ncbi:WecB/TagA/CpsF family glycosyltransferase [Alteribacter populi]|uniref:WecB/TagA/CpsF family glycosyltransferase n=1 Tax=Alteribacter populi TaxID=2011011 RepID=UPI000BBA8780|nr:WecB/TagA/CpsF family glycosyltransferase [Alteribacter populi]